MSDIEVLEELQERAPATFLRALDVCHALAAKGFEPTALEVRKKLENRGSLEVIQAAVKRYRELSGYIGPGALLPVTLANDLVLAAEAVFKRYQKREEERLDTLSEAYAVSVEGLVSDLQSALRDNDTLQARIHTLEKVRDEMQVQVERHAAEAISLRAKLQLAHEGAMELKGRVEHLEAKINDLHTERQTLQEAHRRELKEQLTSQMTAINKQWEPELGAWKLRFDAERRALEATQEKAAKESAALRDALQVASAIQVESTKHTIALEGRVEHLAAQLRQAQHDADSREAMLKDTLEQCQDGWRRLMEDHQRQGTRLAELEAMARQVVTVMAGGGAPAKVVAALKAVLPTPIQ